MRRSSLFLTSTLGILTLALLNGCASGTQLSKTRSFDITLTDLTNTATNSGQPFSPPVFITHDSSVNLFESGRSASLGIQNIAESGNRTVLVNALQPLVGGSILSLQTPLSSPLLPGSSVTVRVSVDASHPYLSHAWMLGRTNDGFGGQDSINLFDQVGTKTYEVLGLDAGTELNSEKTGFLGALGGGNGRDPENGLIRAHEGITGRGEAPLAWNWSNGATPASQTPVARVTITPVDVPFGS